MDNNNNNNKALYDISYNYKWKDGYPQQVKTEADKAEEKEVKQD